MKAVLLVLLVAVVAIDARTDGRTVNCLKKLFADTNGNAWKRKDNWGTGDPCKNKWFGIKCAWGGDVKKIKLAGNNLSGGMIPDCIDDIETLEEIRVENNDLVGQFPGLSGLHQVLRKCRLHGNPKACRKAGMPFACNKNGEGIPCGVREAPDCYPDIPKNDEDCAGFLTLDALPDGLDNDLLFVMDSSKEFVHGDSWNIAKAIVGRIVKATQGLTRVGAFHYSNSQKPISSGFTSDYCTFMQKMFDTEPLLEDKTNTGSALVYASRVFQAQASSTSRKTILLFNDCSSDDSLSSGKDIFSDAFPNAEIYVVYLSGGRAPGFITDIFSSTKCALKGSDNLFSERSNVVRINTNKGITKGNWKELLTKGFCPHFTGEKTYIKDKVFAVVRKAIRKAKEHGARALDAIGDGLRVVGDKIEKGVRKVGDHIKHHVGKIFGQTDRCTTAGQVKGWCMNVQRTPGYSCWTNAEESPDCSNGHKCCPSAIMTFHKKVRDHFAPLEGEGEDCTYRAAEDEESFEGTCINTKRSFCVAGTTASGLCPGPSAVKCCPVLFKKAARAFARLWKKVRDAILIKEMGEKLPYEGDACWLPTEAFGMCVNELTTRCLGFRYAASDDRLKPGMCGHGKSDHNPHVGCCVGTIQQIKDIAHVLGDRASRGWDKLKAHIAKGYKKVREWTSKQIDAIRDN